MMNNAYNIEQLVEDLHFIRKLSKHQLNALFLPLTSHKDAQKTSEYKASRLSPINRILTFAQNYNNTTPPSPPPPDYPAQLNPYLAIWPELKLHINHFIRQNSFLPPLLNATIFLIHQMLKEADLKEILYAKHNKYTPFQKTITQQTNSVKKLINAFGKQDSYYFFQITFQYPINPNESLHNTLLKVHSMHSTTLRHLRSFLNLKEKEIIKYVWNIEANQPNIFCYLKLCSKINIDLTLLCMGMEFEEKWNKFKNSQKDQEHWARYSITLSNNYIVLNKSELINALKPSPIYITRIHSSKKRTFGVGSFRRLKSEI